MGAAVKEAVPLALAVGPHNVVPAGWWVCTQMKNAEGKARCDALQASVFKQEVS